MSQGQHPESWGRLWAAVQPHPVEGGELGEYAMVLQELGPREAQLSFPVVADHLRTGCPACAEDLEELASFLEQERRGTVSSTAPTVAYGSPGALRPARGELALGVLTAGAGLAVVGSVGTLFVSGAPAVARLLLIILAIAALAMIVLLANVWGLGARAPFVAGQLATLTITRRGFLVGIAALWVIGTAATFALPAAPTTLRLVLAEVGLRPWLADVIQHDSYLSTIDWHLATPDEAGKASLESQMVLGLAQSAELQGRQVVAVARSPYVVVAWESSLERLGLRGQEPVDWLTIQRQVADPNGPRFVIPLPGTPLGDDGLLLLALAHQGPNATSFAADPDLEAWLRPFYHRQPRIRADERILADDWARYRTNVGEAGLLPEHEALALIPLVEAQARLYVRYPAVNVTRTYALAAPSSRESGTAFERLRSALLSPEAQRSLGTYGFRPIGDAPAPADGPFASQRARGADWSVHWTEAQRTEAFSAWARTWRP